MGIVQEPSSVRPTQQPAQAGQAQDLEAKLFADELRALGQKPAAASVSSEPPEIISVSALADDVDEEAASQPADAQATDEHRPDRLGLDAFDEDLGVRPVVLLSRKRKQTDQHSDGGFLSDLERRIEAEPVVNGKGLADERQPAARTQVGGSSDPARNP
jgi:hypothetical protein